MLISSLHFAVFFFFWCGNTPHAHMLMGENPYGQLINYAGMEEARTSWRCDLQQDPALFCCIFWKVLVSWWRCTSSPHSFQSFDVIVFVTALCSSSPVHSLQPFDVDYGNQFPHLIINTQSATVWRRLRKPVSSSKCLCFLFKNVSS